MNRFEYDKIRTRKYYDYVLVDPTTNSFPMPTVIFGPESNISPLPAYMLEPDFLMVELLFTDETSAKFNAEYATQLDGKYKIIGEDALGGFILTEVETDKVFYWDYTLAYKDDDDYDEEDEDEITSNNMFVLANDLDSFLNQLVLRE